MLMPMPMPMPMLMTTWQCRDFQMVENIAFKIGFMENNRKVTLQLVSINFASFLIFTDLNKNIWLRKWLKYICRKFQ